MIEPCIVAYLGADATIAGLVGNRIRPVEGGLRETRPFITYEVAGDEPIMSHSGPSNFATATVEIGMVADTYAAAAQIADNVKRLCNGVQFSAASVDVIPSILDDESDIAEALEPGTNQMVFAKTMTFRMLYRASLS